jgi:hypothetical protein
MRTASNLAVKNYPRKFVVFSGFDVNEFASKSYLQRTDLLKDRFIKKKRAFRVRLRRGDNAKRMLICLTGAEELPVNHASPSKKEKTAVGPMPPKKSHRIVKNWSIKTFRCAISDQ